MKKTFLTCLAVVALFAIATSATAITCTTDQRPAATLLIPYFQATFNPDGTIQGTGLSSLDTLVTIGNASSAPMLAHVAVWSERTELVLDFTIALTGFDIQSFSVASILRGNLPETPVNQSHVPQVKDSNQVTLTGDVCQRNPSAPVYPSAGGYLRDENGAVGRQTLAKWQGYSGFLFEQGLLAGPDGKPLATAPCAYDQAARLTRLSTTISQRWSIRPDRSRRRSCSRSSTRSIRPRTRTLAAERV